MKPDKKYVIALSVPGGRKHYVRKSKTGWAYLVPCDRDEATLYSKAMAEKLAKEIAEPGTVETSVEEVETNNEQYTI